MDVEKVFLDQIAALEKQLADVRAALLSLQRSKREQGDPGLIYFDWRPLDAARVILSQNGGRMKRSQLVDKMIAGGIIHGKKRGAANIRISLDLNIENGNLIEKGEYIELPK